jgi:hypothetical protein
LNWSFLFFTPAFWISLILLFIRNRNVCLCHFMLLLTLLYFYVSNHNSTVRIIQRCAPSLFSTFKDSPTKFSMDHQQIYALRMVNQFLWANRREVPPKKDEWVWMESNVYLIYFLFDS